jgi:acyl dehydratase
VESEVAAIKPSKSRPFGVVTMRSITLNQDGKAVQEMSSRLVVPKKTLP